MSRWRYTCPEGHHTLNHRANGKYCRVCQERYTDIEIVDKLGGMA